jgi:ketopantoate reductase
MESKKNKTVCIIGVAGRTGAMFARELQPAARIIGVGREAEAKIVDSGNLAVSRGGGSPEALRLRVVPPPDFAAMVERDRPELIWFAVRNPVGAAVKFYYGQLKGRPDLPALVLSQNGLSAVKDAQAALREVLGHEADRVKIVRASLLNGIDLKPGESSSPKAMADQGRTSVISYKLPIKIGIGPAAGAEVAARDLADLLKVAGFTVQKFKDEPGMRAMENSKLFTNLIGMAAAARGMTVSEGFRDKKVFMEEVAMLREFILAVRKAKAGFAANFLGYPIEFLAAAMFLPDRALVVLRGVFERVVAAGRNRPKDMSEIDYYNGEVVRLGKLYGVATPMNESIVARAEARAQKF